MRERVKNKSHKFANPTQFAKYFFSGRPEINSISKYKSLKVGDFQKVLLRKTLFLLLLPLFYYKVQDVPVKKLITQSSIVSSIVSKSCLVFSINIKRGTRPKSMSVSVFWNIQYTQYEHDFSFLLPSSDLSLPPFLPPFKQASKHVLGPGGTDQTFQWPC